ncbi:hypothetical protein FKM82_010810 [Ascaphus truei]
MQQQEAEKQLWVMSPEDEEQSSGYDSKCIFCRISGNQESSAELLHCDEDLVCFKDIRPGAPHHYLVVPKKHVGNCKTLTKDHVQLGKTTFTAFPSCDTRKSEPQPNCRIFTQHLQLQLLCALSIVRKDILITLQDI